jgi:putative nucleotidyltransferase with HDIG domain
MSDLFDTSAEQFDGFPAQSAEATFSAEIDRCLHLDRQRKTYAGAVLPDKAQGEFAVDLPAIVCIMAAAVEAYDQNVASHQVRVAAIACALGREVGWDEQQVQALHVAALLHDVGKLTISQEILNKPGRLDADEISQMKLHTDVGYAMVNDISFTWPIAEAIRQHHERMDGSGYPRGLKGDEILPMARVLAIADVLDAMTSARPYRPALDLEVVLAELEQQAGTLLDADMVEQCISLFRDKQFDLPC